MIFCFIVNKAYSLREQINDGVIYSQSKKKECKSITWKLRVRRNSNSSWQKAILLKNLSVLFYWLCFVW